MSPVRASERDRYPPDWPAISAAIRFGRAGGRCECEGECGTGRHAGRCQAEHGRPSPYTGSQVILTTSHLNHTPEDCAEGNLRAFCQLCHLAYDTEHHAATRAARKAGAEAARPALFSPEEINGGGGPSEGVAAADRR